MNGNLVDIDSEFTNNFLLDYGISKDWSNFGIGATAKNITNDAGTTKIWVWEGSEKIVNYKNWGFKQPSNKGDCAFFSTQDGTWFTDSCSISQRYLCSVPMLIDLCEDDWNYLPSTRFCYKLFFDADWITAEANCLKQNAHLVSIHNIDENVLIHDISNLGESFCKNEESTLIGLRTETNSSADYAWSDGTLRNFYIWASGEPYNITENKCVAMYTNLPEEFPAEYWKSVPCDERQHKYVCKRPPIQVQIQ